jgi:hypothetical protein
MKAMKKLCSISKALHHSHLSVIDRPDTYQDDAFDCNLGCQPFGLSEISSYQ